MATILAVNSTPIQRAEPVESVQPPVHLELVSSAKSYDLREELHGNPQHHHAAPAARYAGRSSHNLQEANHDGVSRELAAMLVPSLSTSDVRQYGSLLAAAQKVGIA